jgi:Na+-translocating ferredoxin:NAD+ oxidoreductase RnfD subunit
VNDIAIYDSEVWHRLQRFVKSPKGMLVVILTAFVLIAIPFVGGNQILPNVLACVAFAALMDLALDVALHDRFRLPDGAMLTGLIVALVLRPQEPLAVAIAVTGIAIGAKHLLRTRWSNVFNPAALALVAGALVFGARQSWWGALPDAGVLGLLAVVAAGLFIGDRINKLPLVGIFLVTYFGLFTVDSFIGAPSGVAEIFRTPDLQAALFFAFFMLDDPPTCPIRYEDQAVFAVIVAATAFVIFKLFGVDYYLASALLAGNAWESGRRIWAHRQAHAAQPRRAAAPAPSGWAPAPPRRQAFTSPRSESPVAEGQSAWRRPS